MAKVRFDMVAESSTTTGTGNFTLGGAKNPGRTFSGAGVAVSDTFKYRISHDANNEWEVGTGTLLTSTTFSRSVIASSNANALVTFSAGNKTVELVVDKADLDGMERVASDTQTGHVELATTAEVLTGTDAARAVTPDALAALWEAGADNAGGATITLGDGHYHNLITSTTTITAFAFTTDKAGRRALVRFATARQVTHNATSLQSPTGGNLQMGVGDHIGIVSLGGGNFRILEVLRADTATGAAVAAITASSSQITNATTNIDCVTFTIPANTLRVGSIYKLSAYLAFVHTAAATPTITTALVVNGVEVLTSVTTPGSVATTLGLNCEAILTCRSTGASGTINSFVAGWCGGATGATQGGANSQDNATTTIDTTQARAIILRVRMTTAVASNSIRCNQAFIQKVN